MDRLTTRMKEKVFYRKGQYSPTTLVAEMEIGEMRECLEKLSDYEDTNLTPKEIKDLQDQNKYFLEKLEQYEWEHGSIDTAIFYAELQGKC